jgi:hypothetical protein
VRGDLLLLRGRVGVIGVVREHPGAELHVEHAPTQSAVRLLGDEGRDRGLTLDQELGSALQQTPPLARRHRRPLWKRPLGRLHRQTRCSALGGGRAPDLMSRHPIPTLARPRSRDR